MNDNVFFATGLLTRFEEKTTNNGNRVCTFSILLPEAKENRDKQQGTFVPVESWDITPQLAKLLTANVKKCRVFVKGRLKLDYWTDKTSGLKRTQLKVIANIVSYLPLQRSSGNNPAAATSQPVAAAAPATTSPAKAQELQYDQEGNPIPF